MATLSVLDGSTTIRFEFGDLVKYHGRASIGGLALGFKVLERGLPLLSEKPVDRRDIGVDTAFDGPGSRDAFEMVIRAVTGNRYRVVPELAGSGAPEAPQGHFVFRLATGSRSVELALRPGLVSDEFVTLVRRGPDGPEEQAYLVKLKEGLAALVLSRPADQVFDAEVIPA